MKRVRPRGVQTSTVKKSAAASTFTRAVWFSAARRQLHTAALWSIFAPPFSHSTSETLPPCLEPVS